MASSIHSVYPQLPPTYPSHGHSNSMNGSFTQSHIASFDASNQSVASTPAQTPPPPRPGSQQQMSFSMNGGHGPMMPPNPYGGYPEPNMFAQPQYQQPPAQGQSQSPQIYTVNTMFDSTIDMLTCTGCLLERFGLRDGSQWDSCYASQSRWLAECDSDTKGRWR